PVPPSPARVAPMRLRLTLTAAALTLASAALALLLLAPAPGAAQARDDKLYKIDKVLGKNPDGTEKEWEETFTEDGILSVRVRFRLRRSSDNSLGADVAREEIVVKEDGQRVKDLDLAQPKLGGALTAVLALDCSGSMKDGGKMEQAQGAAGVFLRNLPDKGNVGLILFDHTIITKQPPADRPERVAKNRDDVKAKIDQARPRGGTAYLDAAVESLRLLEGARGNKAVVVMTDGVDLNSTHTLDQVVALATKARVPVYTIGVGSPGKNVPVTT